MSNAELIQAIQETKASLIELATVTPESIEQFNQLRQDYDLKMLRLSIYQGILQAENLEALIAGGQHG